MFLGEFRHSLDPKGRLAIPARFRQELPEGSVMTMGQQNCLVLATRERLEMAAEEIDRSAMDSPAKREQRLLLFTRAVPLEFDRQGRVMVPAPMRSYARLTDRAVIAGVGRYAQIWAPDIYDPLLERAERHAQAGDGPALGLG